MHDRDPGSDGHVIQRSVVDPHAFAAIFERHFDALYGYVRRRVAADLAEEIATETFTRAFDARRKFDVERADARPWLLGIAANLLRRHWRTERRRLEAYARIGGPRPSTDAGTRVEVVAALDSLSRDERETLFLYAVADLSYEEIADALQIPVGTVRSRLSRARGRIRQRVRSESAEVAASSDPKESFNV
ncbi:MAG TPA: RNA polymerase sigma factor [Gaiellaceae bacterium]|nr:RNA polymerase sigma factor [Gaiellaceae bacterium]